MIDKTADLFLHLSKVMKSGQILVLVLLVVVVALAVGLSVASRNLTNLRTSTQSEQSQRAFSAAEGGIEDILSKITSPAIADDPNLATTGHTEQVTVGALTANITVKSPSNEYSDSVVLGNVAQVDVSPGAASSAINVEWAKKGGSEEANPASIEITVVNSSFIQRRTFWTGGATGESYTDGISHNPSGCSSLDYAKCVQIGIQAGDQLVRIKPFWYDTSVRVKGVGAYSIPQQTYTIESVAKTDTGVTRRVQVNRTKKPQVPAAFDYVLYSENSITK